MTKTSLPPTAFLTTYDVKTGVEMFETQYRWLLKLHANLMNVWIMPILSPRCFHQWGGAKMMLRELQSWMKPGDFVYKTDVYSYYASINHDILIQQLKAIDWPHHLLKTLIAYCERTILRIGPSLHCKIGIPKGGSLSPVLGALYLTPLDHAMERWIARGDCFYARFQDDIILVSRKRHVLKRMRKEMFQILRELRLSLRPEKTFVGRSQKGFDLLGYHITPKGFSLSQKAQEKALENAKQRYAQGGLKPLLEYLNRWSTWVHAGLPSQVHSIDKIIHSLVDKVISSRESGNSQRLPNQPNISASYWFNNLKKGKHNMHKKFLRTLFVSGLFVLGLANSHPSIAMNNDREEELARWAKMLRECPESSSHTHVTWITDGERYVAYRTGRNKKEWQASGLYSGQYVWVPETEYQPCRSCRGRLTTQQVKDAEQYEYRQRPDVRIAMLKAQIEIAELEARLKAATKK